MGLATSIDASSNFCTTARVSLVWPARLLAHCDGLDGPAVKSARAALEARHLARVAIWVQPEDEPEIRRAFEQTVAVRSLSSLAKELADSPPIPAADKALEERSLEPLVQLLTDTIRDRLRRRFNEVVTARPYDVADVAAGREYVRAYFEFIHYLERLYETSTTAAHGHFDEASAFQREHR